MKSKRLVSFLLAIFFTLFNIFYNIPISFAQPSAVASAKSPLNLKISDLKIPSGLGSIQESFAGKSSQTVIYIQDAHAVPDAQKSIQQMISYLQKQYGIHQIALEGGSGELDPLLFKTFGDAQRVKKVFEDYIDRGELSGAAAAAVLNEKPAQYVGIDDPKLYESGIVAFQKAQRRKPEFLKQIGEIEIKLEALKKKIYPLSYLELDHDLKILWDSKRDLAPVLAKLNQIQEPEKYKHIKALVQEIEREKQNTNARQIKDQIRKLSEAVKPCLKGKRELMRLNQKIQAFETGQESDQAVAHFLLKTATAGGLDVSKYPALQVLTANYLILTETQGPAFFEELEAYVHDIKNILLTKSESRLLDELDGRVRILHRLANLELTREEWDRFQKEKEKFQPWVFEAFLSTVEKAPIEMGGVKINRFTAGDSKRSFSWESNLEFYETVSKRDQAFLENLKKIMKPDSHPPTVSILITGGFHTKGLTEQFKRAGISYALISPHISQLPEENLYLRAMSGDVSWKKYFEVKNGKVNLYNAFARATVDQLLKDRQTTVDSPKRWRDNILMNLAAQGKITSARDYTRFIDEAAFQAKDSSGLSELHAQWHARIDQFLNGLKNLIDHHQLTEDHLLELFRPQTTAAPAAVGSVIPASEMASSIFQNLTSSLPAISVAHRSEVRNAQEQITALEYQIGIAGFLSHVIGNTMTPILGYLDWLGEPNGDAYLLEIEKIISRQLKFIEYFNDPNKEFLKIRGSGFINGSKEERTIFTSEYIGELGYENKETELVDREELSKAARFSEIYGKIHPKLKDMEQQFNLLRLLLNPTIRLSGGDVSKKLKESDPAKRMTELSMEITNYSNSYSKEASGRMAFLSQKKLLAMAGKDGNVIFWDVAMPGAPVEISWKNYSEPVDSIQFSRDGAFLIGTKAGEIIFNWPVSAIASQEHSRSEVRTEAKVKTEEVVRGLDGTTPEKIVAGRAAFYHSKLIEEILYPVNPSQLQEEIQQFQKIVAAVKTVVEPDVEKESLDYLENASIRIERMARLAAANQAVITSLVGFFIRMITEDIDRKVEEIEARTGELDREKEALQQAKSAHRGIENHEAIIENLEARLKPQEKSLKDFEKIKDEMRMQAMILLKLADYEDPHHPRLGERKIAAKRAAVDIDNAEKVLRRKITAYDIRRQELEKEKRDVEEAIAIYQKRRNLDAMASENENLSELNKSIKVRAQFQFFVQDVLKKYFEEGDGTKKSKRRELKKELIKKNRHFVSILYENNLVGTKSSNGFFKMRRDLKKKKQNAEHLLNMTEDVINEFKSIIAALISEAGKEAETYRLEFGDPFERDVILIIRENLDMEALDSFWKTDGPRIRAFVMTKATLNSHPVIVSQTLMNPPAVVIVKDKENAKLLNQVKPGDPIIVSTREIKGESEVTINPDPRKRLWAMIEAKRQERLLEMVKANIRRNKPVTSTYANITTEFPEEIGRRLKENQADGVGLTRTEVLSKEIQEAIVNLFRGNLESLENLSLLWESNYKDLFMSPYLRDKTITMRTLDIQKDKNKKLIEEMIKAHEAGSIHLENLNKILGFNFYRTEVGRKILVRQLAAFYVAYATLGTRQKPNLKVMFPLVKDASDLDFMEEIIHEAIDIAITKLEARGIPHASAKITGANIQFGIMIETVEAVGNIDSLLRHKLTTFASVGLNDLFADEIKNILGIEVSRDRPESEDLLTRLSPFFIHEIEKILEAVNHYDVTELLPNHRPKFEISFCGELAGKNKFTLLLYHLARKYEVQASASMSPDKIPFQKYLTTLINQSVDLSIFDNPGGDIDTRAERLASSLIENNDDYKKRIKPIEDLEEEVRKLSDLQLNSIKLKELLSKYISDGGLAAEILAYGKKLFLHPLVRSELRTNVKSSRLGDFAAAIRSLKKDNEPSPALTQPADSEVFYQLLHAAQAIASSFYKISESGIFSPGKTDGDRLAALLSLVEGTTLRAALYRSASEALVLKGQRLSLRPSYKKKQREWIQKYLLEVKNGDSDQRKDALRKLSNIAEYGFFFRVESALKALREDLVEDQLILKNKRRDLEDENLRLLIGNKIQKDQQINDEIDAAVNKIEAFNHAAGRDFGSVRKIREDIIVRNAWRGNVSPQSSGKYFVHSRFMAGVMEALASGFLLDINLFGREQNILEPDVAEKIGATLLPLIRDGSRSAGYSFLWSSSFTVLEIFERNAPKKSKRSELRENERFVPSAHKLWRIHQEIERLWNPEPHFDYPVIRDLVVHFKDVPGLGSRLLPRLWVGNSRQFEGALKEAAFEAYAAKYFEDQGAKIKFFNVYLGDREIDFIMKKDGGYYLVEVKEHGGSESNDIISGAIKSQVLEQIKKAKSLSILGIPIRGVVVVAGGPNVISKNGHTLGTLNSLNGQYELPVYTIVLPPFDILARNYIEKTPRPDDEQMEKWASEKTDIFTIAKGLGWKPPLGIETIEALQLEEATFQRRFKQSMERRRQEKKALERDLERRKSEIEQWEYAFEDAEIRVPNEEISSKLQWYFNQRNIPVNQLMRSLYAHWWKVSEPRLQSEQPTLTELPEQSLGKTERFEVPTENIEDAQGAWDWLVQQYEQKSSAPQKAPSIRIPAKVEPVARREKESRQSKIQREAVYWANLLYEHGAIRRRELPWVEEIFKDYFASNLRLNLLRFPLQEILSSQKDKSKASKLAWKWLKAWDRDHRWNGSFIAGPFLTRPSRSKRFLAVNPSATFETIFTAVVSGGVPVRSELRKFIAELQVPDGVRKWAAFTETQFRNPNILRRVSASATQENYSFALLQASLDQDRLFAVLDQLSKRRGNAPQIRSDLSFAGPAEFLGGDKSHVREEIERLARSIPERGNLILTHRPNNKVFGLVSSLLEHLLGWQRFRGIEQKAEALDYEAVQNEAASPDPSKIILVLQNSQVRIQKQEQKELTFILDAVVLKTLRIDQIAKILLVIASAPAELRQFYFDQLAITRNQQGLAEIGQNFVNRLLELSRSEQRAASAA